MSSSAEKYFYKKAQQIPSGVTPGFVVQAYKNGKKVIDVEYGKTWKYYDLASLTKIFFTVPQIMRACDQKKLNLSSELSEALPWCPNDPSIKDVLSHMAGNDWWQPFYKQISIDESVEYKKNQLRQILRRLIPQKNPAKAIYSDVDFFFLGFLVEEVFSQSWESLWSDFEANQLNGAEVFFHPQHQMRFQKNLYAPTEKCPWREKIMQGEVHDENAWSLGGVAPHAGLFGSIEGVSQWGLWLRDVYLGKNKSLSAKTLRLFAQRATDPEQGDWGLGFMLPTKGTASCGSYFSEKSIGHTGFTGTSFWFDPSQDIFISVLSNRIHPDRDNQQFRLWRPQIHNWVMESLQKRTAR